MVTGTTKEKSKGSKDKPIPEDPEDDAKDDDPSDAEKSMKNDALSAEEDEPGSEDGKDHGKD